jgi:Sulfotransferase family
VSSKDREGSLLQRYVPGHFNNPLGLAARLIRTGDRAAFYAMWTAAVGLALTPLDMILAWRERELYARAADPEQPIVLVCGPSRAGTTLTEQVLITSTHPTYLNNLSALFPRSPIIANRALASLVADPDGEFHFYYGKSVGLAGLNDALYLWDLWMGAEHRSRPPTTNTRLQLDKMRRFFGALQQEHLRPVVNKNNHLNCCAHLVAPALPTAVFLCLRRSPEHLAQSLLRARRDIHGDLTVPYGIGCPVDEEGVRPIESVCRQVLYHERMARWQQEQLGPDRFRIVEYEELCRNPHTFASETYEEFLVGTGHPPTREGLTSFEPSTRLRVAQEEYDEILATLGRIEGREELYWQEPESVQRATSSRQ